MEEQKVALISGCSSGFGLVSSIALAKAGFRVFASMRNLSKRAAIDAAAKSANVTINIVQLDVTKVESIQQAVQTVLSEAKQIDVLVNNAGVLLEGFVEELTLEEIRTLFETNFFGLVALTKAIYPSMRERRSGKIINISSLAGLIALPNSSAYTASKFAVQGFSESLRYEAFYDGISVSLIEPGCHLTEIRESNFNLSKNSRDASSPHYKLSQNVLTNFEDFFKQNAGDPEGVAKTVVRIATTKNPKLHYRVISNMERINFYLNKLLPSSIFEKLVRSQLKLTTR